jgi:hypothetical protein
MPPRHTKFWRTSLGGPQPPPGPLLAGGDGERAPHLFSPLARYLDEWIPKAIFAAPRSSSPRGGASYSNRKAA